MHGDHVGIDVPGSAAFTDIPLSRIFMDKCAVYMVRASFDFPYALNRL